MKAITSIYLLILGLVLGVEVAIGLSAGVLFRSDLYIEPGTLSTLQAGTLLGQVFIKYNFLALGVAVFAILFEVLSWKKSNAGFKIKFSGIMLSVILFITGMIFWQCTEYILAAAKLGESALNEEFTSVHKASEMCLKIAMIARVILFFVRFKIFAERV